MGQRSSKVEQAEPTAPTPSAPSGLTPRNVQARRSCNTRRVRHLIRRGRLGPCWTPLSEGEGEECPICNEDFARLNNTACCHQPICTECFINVVAPSGGLAARCPYCQGEQLQVYLPPPPPATPCAEAEAQAEAGSESEAEAQEPSVEAESEESLATPCKQAAPALYLHLDATASTEPTTPQQLSREGSGSSSGGGGGCSGSSGVDCSTAISGWEEQHAPGAPVKSRRHLLMPSPQPALRSSLQASCNCACDDTCSAGSPRQQKRACTLAAAGIRPLPLMDIDGLAVAAAEASRQPGPAVVAMVLSGSPTPPTVAAASQATVAGSFSGAGQAGGEAMPPSGPAVAGLPPAAAGGPALLLNPDGTEQLVLLSSGSREEGNAEDACAQQEQGAGAGGEQPSVLPSYQAPGNPEDDSMRRAIARADAAMRPSSASQRSTDGWLARLQQADAALQAAVARNDQHRFGSSNGGSGAGA